MQKAKKILATLLPAGMVLIGSAGIAAADSYSNADSNWNTNWNQMNHDMQWGGANSDNADQMFEADTRGQNEVPSVPDMTNGHISVRENSNDTMSYTYTLQNGKKIVAAHLHCAPEGENGPAVATLYMSMGQDVNGTLASGQITDSDILPSAAGCEDTIGYGIYDVQDLKQALEDGDIYANAHSMDYPDGVSRGQLEDNSDSWNGTNDAWNNSSDHNGWNDRWNSDNSNWNDSSSSNWSDSSHWNSNWNSNDSSDTSNY